MKIMNQYYINRLKGIKFIKELELEEDLELSNLDNLVPTTYLIGIWAQLDVLDKYTFNNSALQIPSKYAGQKHKRYDKNGNPYWKEVNPTKQCGDVWEINKVKGGSKEDTKHKTQKPLMICDRIILASSNEEDLIYIPFGGSGSEIVSCIINNRNYIATEINKEYIDEIIIPRIKELK